MKERDKLPHDLIEFPTEILDKMTQRQKEAGNPYNPSALRADTRNGGFTWDDTEEGHEFWHDVITYKDFDVFYAKYPQEIKFSAWKDKREDVLQPILKLFEVEINAWDVKTILAVTDKLRDIGRVFNMDDFLELREELSKDVLKGLKNE